MPFFPFHDFIYLFWTKFSHLTLKSFILIHLSVPDFLQISPFNNMDAPSVICPSLFNTLVINNWGFVPFFNWNKSRLTTAS